MATYYVGPGGNDGNAGTSWALRKLTLNGAEDIPVAAGDTVYVAPGVYRESLTCDVSGSSGSPITYIADVLGANTDGIGGIIRITGSDNDQTATRSNCITASNRTYRTFRGFYFDTSSSNLIDLSSGPQNWIIEDCVFQGGGNRGISFVGTTSDNTVRRCLFVGTKGSSIVFGDSSTHDNTSQTVENCIILFSGSDSIEIQRIGGITVKNCLIAGANDDGVDVSANLSVGQTVDVNNCIVINSDGNAFESSSSGFLVEDYNTLYNNNADRQNVSTGTNSVAYPPLLALTSLLDGFCFASGFPFELSCWSEVKRIAGTSESSDDFFGKTRPTTSAKNSWGAIQFVDTEVESGTVQAGTYGRVLNDAGEAFVRRVPVDNTSTTITLYVRRETNYAGSVPRLIVREPGQSDSTDDMTAAVDTWEQLSVTLTPQSTTRFVDVLVESRNTATSGSYAVFYDTMGGS